MRGKDFVSLADFSREELETLLARAAEGKKEWKEGRAGTSMAGKVLGLIFHKPSLRTRVSFEVAATQLGGHAVYLTDKEIGVGSRESVQDVGEVMGRYVDVILIRTFDHAVAEELARHTPVPVINGLTGLLHPCQIVADLQTILEHRESLEGMIVSYFGDGNNVAHSWINAAGSLPFTLRLAVPERFEPDGAIVDAARQKGGKVEITRDPAAAADGADVLYTDVWASMGQEDEKAERAKAMASYQINESLLGRAKQKALVLHCLPAHRGEEITAGVLEGTQSVVYDEAENRLHAQKAILETVLRMT